MIRIARVRDRTASYYLADGVAGRWTGQAAASLGLEGILRDRDLRDVLEGKRPGHSTLLVDDTRFGRTTVAFDVMFAAPKTVSLAMALSPGPVRECVVNAHDRGVADALDYIAVRACGGRRREGLDETIVPIGGLAAARFDHQVSRSLEPHLHSHVLVANLGHGLDGRWSSIDSRGLYAHLRAAGSIYDARLRHEMTRELGVAWESASAWSYEVKGVDPVLIGMFSSRRAAIREDRYFTGHGSRVASLVTREPKTHGADARTHRERWLREATAAGIEMTVRTGVKSGGNFLEEYQFSARLRTSDHVAVARRDVVAAWATASVNGGTRETIERCVDELIGRGDELGVRETRMPLRGITIDPVHARALGPRPTTLSGFHLWRDASALIDEYRSKWEIDGASEFLDPETPKNSFGTARLVDHLELERILEDTRRKLGYARSRDIPDRVRSCGM